MRIVLLCFVVAIAGSGLALIAQNKQITTSGGSNPQLEYQMARAEAAEARAELAEAAAAVNLAQLQAASATIDYLRKYNDLKATKDAKDRALVEAKAKLEPQTAK